MTKYFLRELTSICKNSAREPQINYTDVDGEILYEKKRNAESEKYQRVYELIKDLADVGNIQIPIQSITDLKNLFKESNSFIWGNENGRSLELIADSNHLKLHYSTPDKISDYDFFVDEIEEENIIYLFAKQNFTYREFKPEVLSVIGTDKDAVIEYIDFIHSNDSDNIYYDYNLQILDKSNKEAFMKVVYVYCEKVFTGEFHPDILSFFDKDLIHNTRDIIRMDFLKQYNHMKEENNRLHYEKMMLNSRIQKLEDELHSIKYPSNILKDMSDGYLFEKPRDFKAYSKPISVPF